MFVEGFNLYNDYDNDLKQLKKDWRHTTWMSEEQKMFVQNLYLYLIFDQENDYIIDLDNVYVWIGFSVKSKAKSLLKKHFTLDID
jgi:hypothetical protein